MANEVRGILYETIAHAALERAVQSENLSGTVRWNEKPASLSVVPDFTIAINPDQPSHVVLVTASGAARNSEIKAWRNMGEMQEVKAQLPGPPIVINLYFMSEVKKGVSEAANTLYDVILNIPEKPYYAPLETWVEKNLYSHARTQEGKIVLLAEDLAKDKPLNDAIDALANDLVIALKQRKADMEPLWTLMREDYQKPHHPPIARRTAVKRGLAKLMILEPDLRQKIYDTYEHGNAIPRPVPEYAFDLGLLTKTLAGERLMDDEILNVLNHLGAQKCEELIQKAPAEMSIWINPLRDLDRVEVHVDFVESHYDEFIDAPKLEHLLMECYNDPAKLSGAQGDEKVWVFEILISLLKAKTGKLQGYGAAQIAEDTQISELKQGLYGVFLTPFIQRERKLKPKDVKALAEGLAKRFGENVKRSEISKLKDSVRRWVIKENLEDRLIPYRNFEPILWLLEDELNKHGKIYSGKSSQAGWINEYAGVGHNVATTPFVRVGNTLIHWKTGSDAGKGHKRKELSARVRSARYKYETSTKTFSQRAGDDRYVLIIDGTFNDDDLRVLSESGWDEIIYPDEIPTFVSGL